MTDQFLRTHPIFTQTSLLFIRLLPLIDFVSHKIEILIATLHMPTKTLNNSPSGKMNVQFQFNLLKHTQHDLNTIANDITTAPSVKKFNHHQIYNLFLEQKHPLKLSHFKTTNSPLHSLIIPIIL